MKNLVAFFEIPAADFNRAVKFYEQILQMKLEIMDCENEKMAFFPAEDGLCPGAISWTAEGDFNPGKDGVLISLSCDNMEQILQAIQNNNGSILTPKTRIEVEGKGFFAIFTDSEGNKLGLYSEK